MYDTLGIACHIAGKLKTTTMKESVGPTILITTKITIRRNSYMNNCYTVHVAPERVCTILY